ncbi:MAG TPA: SpoIIE family protein phosphatase [Planctomycetota bacterium]|nr:SpoIIE family protein phosphatase [Planctomycetota bacterium]
MSAAPIVAAIGAPSILVVDDAADNRRLIEGILRLEGYALSFAHDGEQALAVAEENPPDLVLLDVIMPGLDGFETCRRLKERAATAEVPVIFLTGLDDSADKVRGLRLGAVDWVAKPFNPAEVRARVSNQVRLRQLQRSLRQANAELQARQDLLQQDLLAAADIQRALLPRSAPVSAAFELAWRFVPCEAVGGDIFHVLPLGQERYAFWLLDVAGHGVPAAMVTVSVAQALSAHAGLVLAPDGEPAAPADVLRRLDREFPYERFGRHVTVAYALLDARTGELRTSLAAHPAPLLARADGTVERLPAGGTVIGLSGVLPFEEQRVWLRAGDRLLLHTDGLLELEGLDGGFFGEERLARCLSERREQPLQAACDALLAELAAFAGGQPPRDDMTFLALHVHGPPAGGPPEPSP